MDIHRGEPLLQVHLLKGDEGGNGVKRSKEKLHPGRLRS